MKNQKSLMFKCGRIQKRIPPQLVCGSHAACLDCMLPGLQVRPLDWDFFCIQVVYSDSEDSDSLLHCDRPSVLCRSLVG